MNKFAAIIIYICFIVVVLGSIMVAGMILFDIYGGTIMENEDKVFDKGCILSNSTAVANDISNFTNISNDLDCINSTNILCNETILQLYTNPYPDCDNMALGDAVTCVVDYTRGYYKYKVTDDNITLSVPFILLYGGDCKNWAEYYIDQMQHLGINAAPILFNYTNIFAHEFAMVYDTTGYCIIDSLNYHCVDFA